MQQDSADSGEWIVLAGSAGLVQRAATNDDAGPRGTAAAEVPGGAPVETPLQSPQESPAGTPEEHPDSRPGEQPGEPPLGVPSR